MSLRLASAVVSLSLAALLGAPGCSDAASGSASPPSTVDSDGGASDARDLADPDDASAASGAFVPTPHPPYPVIPNQGGPIVAHPEIVTITWTGDPIAPELEAFDAWMVTSSFWSSLMAEWGVGSGSHAGAYRVPTSAPATLAEDDVAQLIEAAILAGKVPSPSPSRIYTVYPPAGTVVMNGGVAGCAGFQAYHSSFRTSAGSDAGDALAIYAITPRCSQTQGMSAKDFTTWGMSHEVMEASTDPDYRHSTFVIDAQTSETPETGENADLCTGHPMRVDGFTVTRNWSNVAAAKGENPCVPAPPGPSFGVFADASIVQVGAGVPVDVPLHVWSDAPMPPLRLSAFPLDPTMTASLSSGTGQNGDTVTLTLRAKTTPSNAPGMNLVYVYAVDQGGYNTRRALLVRPK